MSGDRPTRTPTPRPRARRASDPAEQAADLRAEQRRRWRAGDQVPLEALLADRPHLAADPALLLDLAYSEFVLAREVGAPADPAAYAARFPSVAAELAEQLELECALIPGAEATATAPPAAGPPAPGPYPRLAGFEIEGELGRGGMGVVYKARQVRLNRVVAVKTLPDRGDPDAADAVRFLAEAELVAAVKHPHVVAVFEFGQADGRPYFAMEYLAGGSLRDRLRGGRALPPIEAAGLMVKIARGVQAAHDQQVVHRDLKPANVLFDEHGQPRVTDFGLARRGAGVGLTATQMVLGTPAYMAPEQAEGRGKFVGPAADVYALGAVLYECLTGSVPFPGDDPMAVLRQVMQDDPDPPRKRNPAVPADLELVCLKCLAKDPADRYPTAAALADDLDRFAAGLPVTVRAAGSWERVVRWAKRHPRDATLIGTVALLLLALAGGGTTAAVWMRQERDKAQIAEGVATRQRDEIAAGQEELRQELIRSNRAIPGEVRAKRLRGEPGQFFTGLPRLREALRAARDLNAPAADIAAIRDEMMNLFAVTDVAVADEWAAGAEHPANVAFARGLDRYALLAPGRPITIHEAPSGREVARLATEVDPRESAEFSPDGRSLLVWDAGRNRLDLWDLDGDTTRPEWRQPNVQFGTFLADGRVATTSLTNPPRVEVLARPPGPRPPADPRPRAQRPFEALPREVLWQAGRVTISNARLPGGTPAHPSRPWLVVERAGRLAVVDLDTGRDLGSVEWKPSWDDTRVAWHPTRPVLAYVTGAELRQWDVLADHQLARPVLGPTYGGLVPGYSPDGELVLGVGWWGVFRAWDAHTGALRLSATRQLPSHQFVWDPRVAQLGGGANGRQVQRLRVHHDRGLRVVPVPDPTTGFFPHAHLSPDGRLLAAHLDTPRAVLLDPHTGAALATLPGAWDALGFTPDGSLVTIGEGGVQRWPVRHAGDRCTVGPPTALAPPVENSEWGMSATAGVLAEPFPFRRGFQVRWADGRPPMVVGGQPDVRTVAVSPDGRWAVAGSHELGSVTAYAADTGKLLAHLLDSPGTPRFSPDGRLVGVNPRNGRVWVFEAVTWKERWQAAGHGVAFGPPGSGLVAVGEAYGIIRIVTDTADQREVARLEVPDATRLVPEAFGPDGRLVAHGQDNRQLYIWDLRHLRERLTAEGLDWECPPFPSAADRFRQDTGLDWAWPKFAPPTEPAPPAQVRVVAGADAGQSTEARRLVNEAIRAVRAGDPATAADRIRCARALNPDDPDVARALAHLLIHGPTEVLDPRAAEAYARRAVVGRPDDPRPHAVLGVARYRQGDYRGAAASLERGLRDPTAGYSYGWFTLARSRLWTGDWAGAVRALNQTVRAWVADAGELLNQLNRPAGTK